MDVRPIYLAGIERSGTSLMYALLASHPSIAMTRRTNLWTYFYKRYGDLSQAENLDRCLDVLRRYKRMRPLQPDFERLRQDFLRGQRSYARLFALLEGQWAEKLGKARWGDKSLNTERFTDDIFAEFPQARIIHMMRDPRDRYASARSRWKKMTGKAGVGTAMWLESARLARRNLVNHPGHYMVVRYEALVARPEQTLRDVCCFLDEEYAPEMLNMGGAPQLRDNGGNSSYGKREAGVIAQDSIARYRKVLSAGEIAFIQARCKEDMRSYQYELDSLNLSTRDRLLYWLRDWPLNAARMTAWQAKEWVRNWTGRRLPARRLLPDPEVRPVT